jgi:hypothetical protein
MHCNGTCNPTLPLPLKRASLFLCWLRHTYRSGPVARNGLSLARNGCSSRSFHYEVNVPGLLLRFLPPACTARSDLRSATGSGSPRTMAASLRKPRCSTLRTVRLAALPTPTPPQDYHIPQDQSQNRLGRHSARLPDPPDSLSLPAIVSIASCNNGSTFLVRYVSGGSLFLYKGFIPAQCYINIH